MAHETEIKVRLASEQLFVSVLNRCQTTYSEGKKTLQRDEYFDTLEERLKEHDFTVRLRLTDNNLKVALKSPRIFLSDKIHQRIELEFGAADEREVRAQLKRQGLSPTAIIEKHRWTFTNENIEIAIDKLPFIGSFLEIEGSDVSSIEKVLAALQLSTADAVRENYSELLERELSVIGLPLRPNLHATFEAETSWKKDNGL